MSKRLVIVGCLFCALPLYAEAGTAGTPPPGEASQTNAAVTANYANTASSASAASPAAMNLPGVSTTTPSAVAPPAVSSATPVPPSAPVVPPAASVPPPAPVVPPATLPGVMPKSPRSFLNEMSGTILSVDADGRVLRVTVQGGFNVDFPYDNKTVFTEDSKPLKDEDLTYGDKVTVRYAGKELLAHEIERTAKAPAPPP